MPKLPGVNHLRAVKALEKAGFYVDSARLFFAMAPVEGEQVSLYYAFDEFDSMAVVDHTRVMIMLKIGL